MANNEIEKLQNKMISEFNTTFKFTKQSFKDYKSFAEGKRLNILSLIYKQAEKGALLKPDGTAKHCNPPLHQFGKIKNRQLNIRIIYRPHIVDNVLCMDIIAIGPRDKDIYDIAEKRLNSFFKGFEE